MAKKSAKKPPKLPPKSTGPAPASRLAELTPEQQQAVDTHLETNNSALATARMIQKEWGLFTDVAEGTLKKQLQRYMNRVIVPRVAKAAEKVSRRTGGVPDAPAVHAKKLVAELSKIKTSLDVKEHFEEVVRIQRDRILKLYRREQKMPDGVVLESLTKLFKDYNHSLSQLAHLQLETGVLKRAPKVLTGTFGMGDDQVADPVYEIEFRAQMEYKSAISEITALAGEAIEGEFSRVEPGDAGVSGEAAAGG